jgi:hypothetical protein
MDKESFDGANCTETHLSYFYTEDGGSMYLWNITNTAYIDTVSTPIDQYQQQNIAKAWIQYYLYNIFRHNTPS